MSTFACHCGSTVTGTSAPDTERDNQPNWTFNCADHQGGGARDLLIVKVWGTPWAEESQMELIKQDIDANEQWYIDNPSPSAEAITSNLVL